MDKSRELRGLKPECKLKRVNNQKKQCNTSRIYLQHALPIFEAAKNVWLKHTNSPVSRSSSLFVLHLLEHHENSCKMCNSEDCPLDDVHLEEEYVLPERNPSPTLDPVSAKSTKSSRYASIPKEVITKVEPSLEQPSGQYKQHYRESASDSSCGPVDRKSFLLENFSWFVGEVRKPPETRALIGGYFDIVCFDGLKHSSLYKGHLRASVLKVQLNNKTEVAVKVNISRPDHDSQAGNVPFQQGESVTPVSEEDECSNEVLSSLKVEFGEEEDVDSPDPDSGQYNDQFHRDKITDQERQRPFVCDICSVGFLKSSHLKRHKLVHTEERRYLCEMCSKSFKHYSDLERHQLIHTDIKPFTCPECSRSFKQKSNMVDHRRRKHSLKEPFNCRTCSASFATCAELKDHRDHVHSCTYQVKCDLCSRPFASSSELQAHMRNRHNPNFNFKCKNCSETFASPTTMQNHWMRKHRE